MPRVGIALGSNLGQRLANQLLHFGRTALHQRLTNALCCLHVYQILLLSFTPELPPLLAVA